MCALQMRDDRSHDLHITLLILVLDGDLICRNSVSREHGMNWKFKRGRAVLGPNVLQTGCLTKIKFEKEDLKKYTLALPSFFLWQYILFLLLKNNIYFGFNYLLLLLPGKSAFACCGQVFGQYDGKKVLI